MAVYTEISLEAAQSLCDRLELGHVTQLRGISGGIENTNYFIHTRRSDEDEVKRVLTVFERLSHSQLPYYLDLMRHLAKKGIAVPDPVADPYPARGAHPLVHSLAGKPASIVSCLRGQSELSPTAEHCEALGRTLAEMHLAGADFEGAQGNLRGLVWWQRTVPGLLKHLDREQSTLLQHELAYQTHVAQTAAYAALPRGPVHADLFRDNVMFELDPVSGPRLSGVFDFYFAGQDALLFDLAVALNDWAIDHATGAFRESCFAALLNSYQSVRRLTAAERSLMPALLRAGALRFWISRLWDWHLPREASLLKPHDPTHFERVLRLRSQQFVTV